jgi:MerR family transcriptional regulator/heat shock protein HspR
MMPGQHPFNLSDDTPVYVISVAAQLSGLHPQTLRQYDRLGLVSPDRSPGRGRRYSARDIAVLREVQGLSQREGVNLAGIKRVLELQNQVDALRQRLAEVENELAAVSIATARSTGATPATGHAPTGPRTTTSIDALLPTLPMRTGNALVVWRPASSSDGRKKN